MSEAPILIRTARDADGIREEIEALHDGFYPEGRIDWDDFLYRLENQGFEFSDADDCLANDPAIKRVKQIVRELRRG